MRFCLKWGVPLLTDKWTGWSVYHVYPFALKGINLLTAIEISKQKYKFIEYYYAVFLFFFFSFSFFFVFSIVCAYLCFHPMFKSLTESKVVT